MQIITYNARGLIFCQGESTIVGGARIWQEKAMSNTAWSNEIIGMLRALGPNRPPRTFRTREEIYAITRLIDAGLCTTSDDLTLSPHKVCDEFGLRPVEWAVFLTRRGEEEWKKLLANAI